MSERIPTGVIELYLDMISQDKRKLQLNGKGIDNAFWRNKRIDSLFYRVSKDKCHETFGYLLFNNDYDKYLQR